MKAKTIKGKSVGEIKSQLMGITSDRFQPTLAIVFVTLIEDWQSIQTHLDSKDIKVFGLITAISFDDQSILNEGIVIMFLDINPDYFKIELADISKSSLSESVSQICKTAKNSFTSPAFLISASDFRNSGDEVMKEFVQKMGNDVTIMGAYCGDLANWSGYVFTNNSSSKNGLMALILDEDKIDVKGIAVSGWKAVGTEKTVTKSDGVWLYSIDNQPAINVLKKFVGDHSMDGGSAGSIIKIDTSTYVLQAKRDGDSPAYFATLEYNKENGGIKCSTPIPEGTKFRFSLPPDFEVVDRVIETSNNLKKTELPEADALLIFSCIGRHITLGPLAADEIRGLSKTWNKPTAGFFSLGEFGRVEGGRPEYHGTTCIWVALKEKLIN